MTEKYWQQEKKAIEKNKDNINPIISQTIEDKKKLIPNKHPKVLYSDCLQGALYLTQWALSDDLNIDDMGMLICRDMGCELTYCQATIFDPYERPFENCDEQFRRFNACIGMEKRRFLYDSEGRTMQQQVAYMLEKKKMEKYKYLFQEAPLQQVVIQKQAQEKETRTMKI
jgi:hypothetical protein